MYSYSSSRSFGTKGDISAIKPGKAWKPPREAGRKCKRPSSGWYAVSRIHDYILVTKAATATGLPPAALDGIIVTDTDFPCLLVSRTCAPIKYDEARMSRPSAKTPTPPVKKHMMLAQVARSRQRPSSIKRGRGMCIFYFSMFISSSR